MFASLYYTVMSKKNLSNSDFFNHAWWIVNPHPQPPVNQRLPDEEKRNYSSIFVTHFSMWMTLYYLFREKEGFWFLISLFNIVHRCLHCYRLTALLYMCHSSVALFWSEVIKVEVLPPSWLNFCDGREEEVSCLRAIAKKGQRLCYARVHFKVTLPPCDV